MQKRRRTSGKAIYDRTTAGRHVQIRSPGLPTLMQACGDVLYAIRTRDGLIKIGWTSNLAVRRRRFGSDPKQILAVTPGSLDDEKAVHRSLAPHVARGREYYHPTPEVLAWVNAIRDRLGVPELQS